MRVEEEKERIDRQQFCPNLKKINPVLSLFVNLQFANETQSNTSLNYHVHNYTSLSTSFLQPHIKHLHNHFGIHSTVVAALKSSEMKKVFAFCSISDFRKNKSSIFKFCFHRVSLDKFCPMRLMPITFAFHCSVCLVSLVVTISSLTDCENVFVPSSKQT